MRRRRLIWISALTAVVASWHLPAGAQLPGPNEVQVRSNLYDPFELKIDPGSAVRWVFQAGGHTVTADDGRFDFDPSATVAAGETREYTFGQTEEVVGYYCRIHGAPGVGMHGYVLVGDVARPTPSPTPSPTPPPERRVPSEYPSISTALVGAGPGTVISIEPGIYREGGLRVNQRGIVLRGTGTLPSDVVIDASGRTDGVGVSAPDVRIEDLTVRGARRAGVSIDGAPRYRLRRVALDANSVYGVTATRSPGGRIEDSSAKGAGEAGISLRSCRDCDTIVQRVTASQNAMGFAGFNAGGVVVRGGTFTGNDAGIVLASVPTESGPPQQGTHIYGNTIADNDGADAPRAGFTETLDAPPGIGVWIAGGWFDTVEDNTIAGNDRYGVVVSWLTTPSLADRVSGNTVSGSGTADLAWDGLGLNVCFSGNTTPDGGEPTSIPAGAQDLYACDAPLPAGIPQPQVDADLFGTGLAHHVPAP